MKIQWFSLDEIEPYEFNNRRHSESGIEKLAKSIKEFGFNRPLVIDENRSLLVGHRALLAARALGMSEVPVLVREGLTERQKRAYRIIDNKISEDSGYDFDNLGLELGFLEDQGFDLESWELNDLLDEKKEINEKKENLAGQLLIVVECLDESQQAELFEELQQRGFQCKLL